MSSRREVVEAENRLERFNAERDRIVAAVEERVVAEKVAAALKGEEASLEYVLNEAAYSEIRRLERARGKERQLQRWRDLALSLRHLSETDKRRELQKLVHHYASEVAGNFDPRVYRFANDVLPPAVSVLLSPIRGFREGVEALGSLSGRVQCEGPFDLIRAACDKGTLVFTPTHSSNLDSITLGLGLRNAGLPPVTYGAGKNLFSNPLISFFMHNLGAYKVDRRLRFQLYKDVLKAYSAVLLERGYHSLFFPGGTRSRSNEVEQHLKLGLLGTAIEAYQHNLRSASARGEIFVVPTTINYRLTLEAETLIEDFLEEEGKSRYIIIDDEFSRLGRVLEFLRKLLAHDGAVVVRFGRPLDMVGNEVDDELFSVDRRGRRVELASYFRGADGEFRVDRQRDAEYTRTLGRAIAAQFRRDTVFQSTALVARAVLDVVEKKGGTDDIYRMLRLPPSAVHAPVDRVDARLSRLMEWIERHPELGRLHEGDRGRPSSEILSEAMQWLRTYHTHPVLERLGERIQIGDMKLLYYYSNRTSHIAPEA